MKTIFDPGADRVLSERELDQITGISKSTRRRLRLRGEFPPQLALSPNRVGHTIQQIRDWKAALPVVEAGRSRVAPADDGKVDRQEKGPTTKPKSKQKRQFRKPRNPANPTRRDRERAAAQ